MSIGAKLKKEKYTEETKMWKKEEQVYSFLRATETNYNKLGGLNQQKCIPNRSGGQKSERNLLAMLEAKGKCIPCFSPSF